MSGGTGGRREALLAAAAALFRERGYYGVGMQDIGRAAGIVGSGVYRHFASKEALLVEITDRLLDGLLAGARATRAEGAGPAATLDALIGLHLDFALDGEGLIAVYLGEERNLPDTDRRRARRKQKAYLQEWVDTLRELRPDLAEPDGHLTAQAIVALLQSVAWQQPDLPRPQVEARLQHLARGALALDQERATA
jgi:AcrR family transcriptional regulator